MRGTLYRLLRYSNDVRAIGRALSTGSATPITNRVGRRLLGKASGRLSATLFPPSRGR